MNRSSDRLVLVLENTALKSAREIVYGVMRYAASRPDWRLEVLTGHPLELEESVQASHPDGIISGFGSTPSNPIPAAIHRRTPTVFTCCEAFSQMKAPHATFEVDDRAIAESAAEILLHKRLQSFGFLGSRHSIVWEARRRKHFSAAIRRTGHAVSVYRPQHTLPVCCEAERIAIAKWLTSLKKPCGIFAVNDRRAKLLLEICEQEGVGVPEQVKVIGVDNDEILCECTKPTLSSIMPDFRKVGYEAARTLDRLMRGEAIPRHLTIGIRELVERMSTSDMTGSNHRVRLALEIVRRQVFNGGITVDGLARSVGCSTRLLLKDFQATLGHSIIDEINRIRLEKVRNLLHDTSADEDSLARAAGFGSTSYLRNLFHKRYGTTMRQWRLNAHLQ